MKFGRAIAVGSVVGVLATAGVFLGPVLADGINWTSRNSTSADCCMSVAYGDGKFVVVMNKQFGDPADGVMVSEDGGASWTSHDAAEADDYRSVTYGNGLFVAVAVNTDPNQVMTSPDGITWTAQAAAASSLWRSVTYGNGLFVAVASSGANRVMTSPDGITWTARTAAATNSWRSVTYGNGLFVAVASSGSDDRVMTSPDGITWTARDAAQEYEWVSVTHGNGSFVAVANSVGYVESGSPTDGIMSSTDGITWTAQQLPSGGEFTGWTSVTYGNGLFVAVGAQEEGPASMWVMTSPDGITWTARTAAKNLQWRSVAYGAGMFVAVSSTSSDMNGQGVDRVMTSGTFTAPPTSTTTTTTTTDAPQSRPRPTTTMPTVSTIPETAAPPTSLAPVLNDIGELPRPEPGAGAVSVNGEVVSVDIFVENETDLVVKGAEFELRISGECVRDCVTSRGPGGREVITFEERGQAKVSGTGFRPGSPVDIWMFSEPRYLGRLVVERDGTFVGQVPLGDLPAGEHTLQVNGLSADNVKRSANLGVIVAPTESFLPVTGRDPSSQSWALMLLAIGGVVAVAGRRPRRN